MRPDRLEHLTAQLIKSYDAQPTRPDQGEPLPSMEAITSVMEEVRRLLFPGFYADEYLSSASRRYRVGHWLDRLHQSLTRVLSLALAHERSRTQLISCEDESLSSSSNQRSKTSPEGRVQRRRVDRHWRRARHRPGPRRGGRELGAARARPFRGG